ncbi:MAG: hypothetical protein KC613_08310, partial [Myxococcales bacterium]|nr:hypothetical protein [Myxococcales bacterium]
MAAHHDSRTWLTCDRCGLLWVLPADQALPPTGQRHCGTCAGLATRPPKQRHTDSLDIPDDSLDGGWLVELPGGDLAGPMALGALKTLIHERGLPGSTRVWSVGLLDWPPIEKLPVFEDLLSHDDTPTLPLSPVEAIRVDPGASGLPFAKVHRRRGDPPTPAKGHAFPELLAAVEAQADESARGEIARAERALSSRRYSLARAHLHRALQHAPQDPDALRMLGLLARLEGDPTMAFILCEKALSVAPDLPAVHLCLGVHHWLEGQHATARRRWREALRLDPTLADALRSGARGFTAFELFPDA